MPIFSYIRRLNKCVRMLFIQIECLVYIHSFDFALIIYVTKIRQFHVSQFWHGTVLNMANFAVRGPSSLLWKFSISFVSSTKNSQCPVWPLIWCSFTLIHIWCLAIWLDLLYFIYLPEFICTEHCFSIPWHSPPILFWYTYTKTVCIEISYCWLS